MSGICWNVIIGAYTGNNSTVDWILHSSLCLLRLERLSRGFTFALFPIYLVGLIGTSKLISFFDRDAVGIS